MFRSKFLNIFMSLLVISSMTLGTTGQVIAQSQTKALRPNRPAAETCTAK